LVVAVEVVVAVALVHLLIVEQLYMLVVEVVLEVEQDLRLYLLVEEYKVVCSNVVHSPILVQVPAETGSHNNQGILQQIHGLAVHLYLVVVVFQMVVDLHQP
jgi:hypothetical protein